MTTLVNGPVVLANATRTKVGTNVETFAQDAKAKAEQVAWAGTTQQDWAVAA